MEVLAAIASLPMAVMFVVFGFALLLFQNVKRLGDLELREQKHAGFVWLGLVSVVVGLMIYLAESINIRKKEEPPYKSISDTRISEITAYSEFGKGDVTVKTTEALNECPAGFWLRSSDPGFDSNLAIIAKAQAHALKVRVYGLPDEKWLGTDGPAVCRLYAVSVFGTAQK